MLNETMLQFGFVLLSVSMILLLGWISKSWKVFAMGFAWGAGAYILATSGWTNHFETRPPRIFLVLLPTFALTFFVCFSRFGEVFVKIPIKTLILIQSFRILVEILIHEAVHLEIAPGQLTWTGWNFDIIAGITALLVGLFADRIPRQALLAWNCIGLFLVLWVVGVAILSVPGPMQLLKPDNVWVARPPYILLPAVLVPIAIGGHLVIFRSLLRSKQSEN